MPSMSALVTILMGKESLFSYCSYVTDSCAQTDITNGPSGQLGC